MNFFDLLALITTILSMMGTCFYLIQITSKMKYSMYDIVARYLLRGDLRGVIWLNRHQSYLWYYLMMCGIIYFVLQISWMIIRNDLDLNGTLFVFSPFIWVSLFFVVKGKCTRGRKGNF